MSLSASGKWENDGRYLKWVLSGSDGVQIPRTAPGRRCSVNISIVTVLSVTDHDFIHGEGCMVGETFSILCC